MLTVSVTVRLQRPLAFDPSDVVVAARVAACARVLRIDGINMASTTGNKSFKAILGQDNPGLPTSIAVEASFFETNKSGCASSA